MKSGTGLVAVTGAFAALSVAVLAPSLPARAAPIAVVDGESFDVSADHLDLDVESGTAMLRGNVSATFGDLQIRCPSVEIRYDRSPRVSFAKGVGGVTARFKGIDVTAEVIELDARLRKVTVSGGVRFRRGQGWIQAERASLDIASGKVSLDAVKGSIPIDPAKQ